MQQEEMHLLDCSLYDLLGEIIRTDVSCDKDRFPTGCFDLFSDRSSLFRINTGRVSRERSNTNRAHSLTTTLAPSLANSNAALLPIPYIWRNAIVSTLTGVDFFFVLEATHLSSAWNPTLLACCRWEREDAPVMMATSPARRPRL